MLNEQNKLAEFPLTKVKTSALEDKLKPLDFHQLTNVNLISNFITDNTDELRSTRDYLAKNSTKIEENDGSKNQEKLTIDEEVDLKDVKIKAAIDQRYQNNLYEIFDQVKPKQEVAKEDKKDDTLSLELDDLLKND
jgi:hypothetical protein